MKERRSRAASVSWAKCSTFCSHPIERARNMGWEYWAVLLLLWSMSNSIKHPCELVRDARFLLSVLLKREFLWFVSSEFSYWHAKGHLNCFLQAKGMLALKILLEIKIVAKSWKYVFFFVYNFITVSSWWRSDTTKSSLLFGPVSYHQVELALSVLCGLLMPIVSSRLQGPMSVVV